MNAPAPQNAAVELWNSLNHLSRDDGVQVERVLWKFRGQVARKPNDFIARMGLARVLLMLGRKSEAMPHVETVWGMRHGQAYEDLVSLGGLLVNCGKLPEMLDLYNSLSGFQGVHNDRILWQNAAELAFRLGDLSVWDHWDRITNAATLEQRRWRSRLSAEGLNDAFQRHQAIAEAIVGPYTSYFHGTIIPDGDGEATAYLEYFTDLDQDARFEIEGAIADRLDSDELIRVADFVTVCVRGSAANRIEAAA
ncbi:hypothetical protein [Roseomonas genomospecies 6]|uniref:Tetratricopeptide repeat protein n=1 Tax=Roseomonas genomospecies 6 TaxID=214106 RepID=A0A9W7NJ72_9PROT|nr:hypothetical protein [Roseomonas genomospecies 6]KAA0680325.1 hypothetical protein DS843_13505 [Roseomonas genomospecies 6]